MLDSINLLEIKKGNEKKEMERRQKCIYILGSKVEFENSCQKALLLKHYISKYLLNLYYMKKLFLTKLFVIALLCQNERIIINGKFQIIL